jgi:hypothetical protein
MAAGLGFKTFTTGEVLSAGDVNGYLMQGILVFASAAARDAAITSPQEGQTCYLKDTDAVMTYSGSAWVAVGASPGASVNLLLNSNFALNQRSYVSAANLSSGTYGFDRWKSNYTNTTLTFTASTQGQSLTINASGGIQQIIEQGLVPAGTYTLSWTGTSTARVYNSGGTPPSYAASPVTFTADGAANVVVEFTASAATKTVSKVMFTAGTGTTWALATPTLQSELAACQRYFYKATNGVTFAADRTGFYETATKFDVAITFPVSMRTSPTLVATSGGSYYYTNVSGGTDYLDSMTLDFSSFATALISNSTNASGSNGASAVFGLSNALASLSFSAEL